LVKHLHCQVVQLVQTMKQINIYEAKTQLSKLVDLANKGESFVIAKSGTPLAKLVPLGESKASEAQVRPHEGPH